MRNIVIDTSSILFGLKFNKNVFEIIKKEYISNYKIILSKSIINELLRISKTKSKVAFNARTALSIISLIKENERKVFIYKASNINVDKWILELPERFPDLIIITNDTLLAKKLLNDNKINRNKNIRLFKLTKQGILKKFLFNQI